MKFYKRYMFRVEIDGLTVASFRTAGPLTVNVGIVEENEGGSSSPTKEFGRVSYENITLTKGVTDNEELWGWMKKAIKGDDDGAEKDLAIVQTDRAGNEIERWNIFNAKPVKFIAGEWDATSNENRVETLELSIESFEKA